LLRFSYTIYYLFDWKR